MLLLRCYMDRPEGVRPNLTIYVFLEKRQLLIPYETSLSQYSSAIFKQTIAALINSFSDSANNSINLADFLLIRYEKYGFCRHLEEGQTISNEQGKHLLYCSQHIYQNLRFTASLDRLGKEQPNQTNEDIQTIALPAIFYRLSKLRMRSEEKPSYVLALELYNSFQGHDINSEFTADDIKQMKCMSYNFDLKLEKERSYSVQSVSRRQAIFHTFYYKNRNNEEKSIQISVNNVVPFCRAARTNDYCFATALQLTKMLKKGQEIYLFDGPSRPVKITRVQESREEQLSYYLELQNKQKYEQMLFVDNIRLINRRKLRFDVQIIWKNLLSERRILADYSFIYSKTVSSKGSFAVLYNNNFYLIKSDLSEIEEHIQQSPKISHFCLFKLFYLSYDPFFQTTASQELNQTIIDDIIALIRKPKKSWQQIHAIMNYLHKKGSQKCNNSSVSVYLPQFPDEKTEIDNLVIRSDFILLPHTTKQQQNDEKNQAQLTKYYSVHSNEGIKFDVIPPTYFYTEEYNKKIVCHQFFGPFIKKRIFLWVDDMPKDNSTDISKILSANPSFQIIQLVSTSAAIHWLDTFAPFINVFQSSLHVISDMKRTQNGETHDNAGVVLFQWMADNKLPYRKAIYVMDITFSKTMIRNSSKLTKERISFHQTAQSLQKWMLSSQP